MTRQNPEEKIPTPMYRDFLPKKAPSKKLQNQLAEQAVKHGTVAGVFAKNLGLTPESNDKKEGESDVPTDRS